MFSRSLSGSCVAESRRCASEYPATVSESVSTLKGGVTPLAPPFCEKIALMRGGRRPENYKFLTLSHTV